MNTNPMPNPLDRNTLFPHQAAFVDRFLAGDSAAAHLLIGPPGAGKTFTAGSILGSTLDVGPNQHILLVVSLSEAVQQQAWLSAAGRADRIRWLDFPRFRELEAESTPERGAWSEPGVYAMSAETARKRQVKLSILGQSWDLMILNDARVLVPEEGAPRETADFHPPGVKVRKTLLVSARSDARRLETALKHLNVCEWSLPMPDSAGNPWPPSPDREDRRFLPSDQERAFRGRLERFIASAVSDARGQFVGEQLAARIQSSPLAIEKALRKLRVALHSDDPHLVWLRSASGLLDADAAAYRWDPPFTEEDDRVHQTVSDVVQSAVHLMVGGGAAGTKPVANGVSPIWKDARAAARELEGLLADFEKIYRDPKLATLLALVREVGTDGQAHPRPVCVFTSFKVTASYLSSALAENERGVIVLTKDTGFQDLRVALEAYNKRGGVLVATSAAASGLDLSRSEVLIHYDQPLSPDEFQTRVSRAPRARSVSLAETAL